MAIFIPAIAAAAGLVLAFFIAKRLSRRMRRNRLLNEPFPAEWEQIVQKNVPLYNRLPDPLKRQLHGLVNVFTAEKDFEGCGGLEITDEIRVTIAAQASMLLLNRPATYFPKLHTIFVYPHTYVANTAFSNGTVVIKGQSVRLGESWQHGPAR